MSACIQLHSCVNSVESNGWRTGATATKWGLNWKSDNFIVSQLGNHKINFWHWKMIIYFNSFCWMHRTVQKSPLFSLYFAVLEQLFFRLSESLSKFFFRQLLRFNWFSVQSFYLTLFRGICVFFVSHVPLNYESVKHKKGP